ncbi:MAG: hypothetical protein NT051_03760 [Candidatus Micrarchaeota archaeon]|nr:hypothetical protein [Candidatus Micrarchaeota archaeon]
MALIMKDGKEIRVPGRAIPAAHCRGWGSSWKSTLRVLDSISLSEFRKWSIGAQKETLVWARYEKAVEAYEKGDISTSVSLLMKHAQWHEDDYKAMVASGVASSDRADCVWFAWAKAGELATNKSDRDMCEAKKNFFRKIVALGDAIDKCCYAATYVASKDERLELMRMVVRMGEIAGPSLSVYSNEKSLNLAKSEIAGSEGIMK